MKLVLGNHWEELPLPWQVLTEQDQDITQPLKFNDKSVDVIFTEHCVEHLDLLDGIFFFREAYRVLKFGGIIRTVAPFVDQLIRFDNSFAWQDRLEMKKDYIETSLAPYYPEHKQALKDLGINMTDHGLPFFLDSLLKKHNHRFVWSSKLMADVLKAIGFAEVIIDLPKRSKFDKSNCIERTFRGISSTEGLVAPLDCESLVVEAKK